MLRRDLNKRFAKDAKQNITSAALFLWKMAQYDVFHDVKFAVPVDLHAASKRDRTLGFVFIRPNTYFDKSKPDRGFFKFQQEFNRQMLAARNRQSDIDHFNKFAIQQRKKIPLSKVRFFDIPFSFLWAS